MGTMWKHWGIMRLWGGGHSETFLCEIGGFLLPGALLPNKGCSCSKGVGGLPHGLHLWGSISAEHLGTIKHKTRSNAS